MDLPVLIPRVKKRPSPRDPRGVVRETTPSNANKCRCRAGRVRLYPLPTFSGRFRCSGRVTAAKPPKEKRGGFGANKFARNPAALFLPAQSAISRPYFRFELRARADSPRFAAVCAAACAHFAALPLVRSTFGLRGFPPISPRCGSSAAHPAGRGDLRPLLWCAVKVPRLSAAVLGLVRVDRVERVGRGNNPRGVWGAAP